MTVSTAISTKVANYINGQWIDSKATEFLDVTNPATGEVIAQTPLSSAAEVGMPRSKPPPPPFPLGAALLLTNAFNPSSS